MPADLVIPVPDSGVPAALGYSEGAGIPFETGLIRNHYVGRTFIEHALTVEGRPLLEQAFDAESRSTPTFLGRRQIVRGNRDRDLEMVNFMASPPREGADRALWVSAVYDAWQFFVKGFQLNGVWQENTSPHLDEPLVSAGYSVMRRCQRSTSEVVTLFHTSRSDGGGMMGSLVASVRTIAP